MAPSVMEAVLYGKLEACRGLLRYIDRASSESHVEATQEQLASYLAVVVVGPYAINRDAAAALLDYHAPGWRVTYPEISGYVESRWSSAVARWRAAVLARDGWQCQGCGSTDRPEAHHLVRWAVAPSLRLVLSNGQTLCYECHRGLHRAIGYWVY